MPQSIRDVHSSGLRLVQESQLTPPSGKYKRISIPDMPNRRCLGYLEGPAASLNEDTRNGRGYILQLWQNVQDSDEFKEGMKYAIIVGELDHPEERVDYSLTKGCVILTDFEIREDEGIVWARFAILDNDQGRILLSYAQFGSVLGVSSRGLGDEIIQNGRNIIDPDTYEFFCFDVVAFPAATCARQQFVNGDAVVESVYTAFSDRVITEAANSQSSEELNQLMNVVESTSISNKKELVETISHRLSSLSESADDQSIASDEKPEDDDREILLGELTRVKSEIADKDSQIEKLKAMLNKRQENAAYFRKAIQEKQVELESLTQSVEDSLDSTSEVSKEYEDLKTASFQRECELTESLNTANRRLQQLEVYKASNEKLIRKYESQLKDANAQVTCAANKLSVLESKVSNLERSNKTLCEEVERYRKDKQSLITESRKAESLQKDNIAELKSKISQYSKELDSLQHRCTESENSRTHVAAKLKETEKFLRESSIHSAKLLDSYLKRSCEAYNLKYSDIKQMLPEGYTEDMVDKAVMQESERRRRIDSLPIAIQPMSGRIVEHKNPRYESFNDESSFVIEALKRGN